MKKNKVKITSDIYLKDFKEFTQYIIDSTQKKQEFLNEISIEKNKIENIEFILEYLYDVKSKLEMEISELKSELYQNKKRYKEDLDDYAVLVDSYYNSKEIDLSEYGILEKVLSKETFKRLLLMLKSDIANLKLSKDHLQKKLNEKKDELNRTNAEIEDTEQEKIFLKRDIYDREIFLGNQDANISKGKRKIKKLGKKMYNNQETKN